MPPDLSIVRLKLTNFRCFASVEIDFHPKLTVLVASNGMGKTSVLDALAVALGPYVGAFDEATGTHFEASDIRQMRVRDTVTNEMEHARDGVMLEASGWIPGSLADICFERPATWARSLTNPTKTKTTIKGAKELIEYGKQIQIDVRTPGNRVVLPLLAYYGTGRLWQLKKLKDWAKLPRTSRTIGYTDCLDPGSSYKSFVAWFHYWYRNALNDRSRALEVGQAYQPTEFDGYIASVRRAVDACLAPVGWKSIAYSFSRDAMVARHDEHGELPVELLSDGIRNMIGLVADIAFRATKLNPQLGANASLETPGIVLIDEVDMHLHPEWQQVVLQGLMQAFPEVQFIVTTHSPQVLSSVDAACIRRLHEEIDPETGQRGIAVSGATQQTQGVASSDLLAEIMGVDPIPNVPQAHWVSDYHALIQQNLHETDDGKMLRSQLEEHFGADHPVMRDIDRMIRLQAFKQKLPRQTSSSPRG